MVMMKNLERLAAVVALSALSACDLVKDSSFDKERADADYRTAMAEYQAGRLESALKGFKKACAADPTNASARFQLACLLQDGEKDYLGAYCAYREYLLQKPQSEKAKLAGDRMVACEREVAKILASKYDLNAIEKEAQVTEGLRKALEASKAQIAKQQKSLGESTRRIAALESETARLKNLLRAEGDGASGKPENPADVKAEVGADDDAPPSADSLSEAKRLLAEDETDEAPTDVSEAKALLTEEPEPPPMIAQAPDAKKRREAAAAAKRAEEERFKELRGLKHEPHPADGHYVVQEGDTLYKIAIRFYGRREAWRGIREANKAIVSMDGRIKTGQRLKLPPANE